MRSIDKNRDKQERKQMGMKGKTTNALMKHIRDNHGIEMNGSKHKRELMQMGYYHAYKRYRFVKSRAMPLQLSSFSEVKAIYDFDIKLKSLLYRPVVEFETVINNYAVDVLAANYDTDLEYTINHQLTNYKRFSNGSNAYKSAYKKYLRLKNILHETIADAYYRNSNPISHFINQSKYIPIWAIFERISMGNTANIVDAMDVNLRINMAKKLGVYEYTKDPKADYITKTIFMIKDLRNAIAHDSPIFDCGFKTAKVDQGITQHLSGITGINNITFGFIIDYLLLLVYYAKQQKKPKREIRKYIMDFDVLIQQLDHVIQHKPSLDRILGSDIHLKINKLKEYT
jgi:abortive infection bacteriophage resistance protein